MKKALALVLALATAITCAACGSKTPGQSANSTASGNEADSSKVYEFTLATTNPLDALDTQCAEKIVTRMASWATLRRFMMRSLPALSTCP